jgi:hypothetical protein
VELEIAAGADPPAFHNRLLPAVGYAFEQHRWGGPPGGQPRRVDLQHAAAGGKIQPVAPALPGRRRDPEGKLAAGPDPIGHAEPLWLDGALAPFGNRIQVRPRNPQHPAARNPEIAIVVFQNPAQLGVRHALGPGESREMRPVDAVETGQRQRPHVSGAVGLHAEHGLARPWPGQQGAESSAIESLHTQRRPHPNGSANTFRHGCHRHRGQAL